MRAKFSWGNTVKAFQETIASAQKDVSNEVEELVDEIGQKVYDKTKMLTPKRTGKLENGWKRIRRGKGKSRTVTITNDVSYAAYVENGTRKMAPRYMLRKSKAIGDRIMKERLRQIQTRLSRKFNY